MDWDRVTKFNVVSILVGVFLMVIALYIDALSPSGVTGLATVLLVLVTVVYTINTREQVNATRASYAPSLDIEVYPKTDYLAFSIVNRGEGVAKNIVICVEVGDYEYNGHITASLSPGECLYSPYGPGDDRVAVVPRFYAPKVERRDPRQTPPRRALRQSKASPVRAMRDTHGAAQLNLSELLEFKRQVGGGYTTSDGRLFLPLRIYVRYSDVNEENEFTSRSEDYDGVNITAEGGSINSILTSDKAVWVFEKPWVKYKRKYLESQDILPFAENLETDVKGQISPP